MWKPHLCTSNNKREITNVKHENETLCTTFRYDIFPLFCYITYRAVVTAGVFLEDRNSRRNFSQRNIVIVL